VGEKLDDVRVHLQSVFATSRALLRIKEPSPSCSTIPHPGTILAQKPPAVNPSTSSPSWSWW